MVNVLNIITFYKILATGMIVQEFVYKEREKEREELQIDDGGMVTCPKSQIADPHIWDLPRQPKISME